MGKVDIYILRSLEGNARNSINWSAVRALDYQLAISVGQFFRLSKEQMCATLIDVNAAVKDWKDLAVDIGISKNEQQLMSKAFNI